jgi:hypothetical protein
LVNPLKRPSGSAQTIRESPRDSSVAVYSSMALPVKCVSISVSSIEWLKKNQKLTVVVVVVFLHPTNTIVLRRGIIIPFSPFIHKIRLDDGVSILSLRHLFQKMTAPHRCVTYSDWSASTQREDGRQKDRPLSITKVQAMIFLTTCASKYHLVITSETVL